MSSSAVEEAECKLGDSDGAMPEREFYYINHKKHRFPFHLLGVKDKINAELCGLLWRTFLGISLLGMLALINFNIQELLACLMKLPVEPSTLQLPLGSNCTSKVFEDDLHIRLEVCHSQGAPAIALYVDESILRVYSLRETTGFVDWARRCGGKDMRKSCHIYPNTNPACPFFAYTTNPPEQHLCYSADFKINYLVIETVRFSKKETVGLMLYILNHPMLKML